MEAEWNNVGSAILIIQGDDALCTRLGVGTAMSPIGAVNNAAMGTELKFGEEAGPAVLVIDTLIVPK